MNKNILYGGAVTLIATGLICNFESFVAGGLVLMWIGASISLKEK